MMTFVSYTVEMKTKLILISLTFMIAACSVFKKEVDEGPSIVGLWQEYVLIDSTYNKVDQAILKISKIEDSYNIESAGSISYSYAHIHLIDNNFTFQRAYMPTTDQSSIVAYNLFVNSDYTIMKGTSYSDQGLTADVEYRLILEK